MGRNDLCREGRHSVGSQASLRGLSSWADASLVVLSFWGRRSKHRPPNGSTKHPARFPQQNGGAGRPLCQPRKPPREARGGPPRGGRRPCLPRGSLRPAAGGGTRSRSRALRLRHCLKTTPRFQNCTGMPGTGAPGARGAGSPLPFSVVALTPGFPFVTCRPVVHQVQEKVFSSGTFHDLGLHPHLVSIRQWPGRSPCVMCSFIQNVHEAKPKSERGEPRYSGAFARAHAVGHCGLVPTPAFCFK